MAELALPNRPAPLHIRGDVSGKSADENVHALQQIIFKLTIRVFPILGKSKMNLVRLENPVRIRNAERIR